MLGDADFWTSDEAHERMKEASAFIVEAWEESVRRMTLLDRLFDRGHDGRAR